MDSFLDMTATYIALVIGLSAAVGFGIGLLLYKVSNIDKFKGTSDKKEYAIIRSANRSLYLGSILGFIGCALLMTALYPYLSIFFE